MTLPAIPTAPASAEDAGVVAFARATPAGFPRAARVRAKAEFARVFDAGKRTAEPRLALHWLADAAPPRLGLAVSRKVDARAVGRNRIKRILRDAFRHLRPRLQGGAYVVVARRDASAADNAALRDAFERLLLRAGALPRQAAAVTMPPVNSLSPSDAAARAAASPETSA